MGNLEAQQQIVHQMLRQDLSVEQAATQLGTDPTRLRIYREFVEKHVCEALSVHFPILRQALTADLWETLAHRFFRTHPPHTYELSSTAAPFPSFLATEVQDGCESLSPFHISLAQFEWEQFAATTHLAEMPTHERLEFPILNPTLSIIEFPCPMVDVMMTWFRTATLPAEPPSPIDGPEIIFFFREEKTYKVKFWRATEELLLALKIGHEASIPKSMEQTGPDRQILEHALTQAQEIGLLIGPHH